MLLKINKLGLYFFFLLKKKPYLLEICTFAYKK